MTTKRATAGERPRFRRVYGEDPEDMASWLEMAEAQLTSGSA